MKDLKPHVRAVYEKRVAYHNEIIRLLNDEMIDVTEPVKEAPNKQQKEVDDSQQEEVDDSQQEEVDDS